MHPFAPHLFFAWLPVSLLVSADVAFYVSPTGNDSSAGTRNSPFLTVQHCAAWRAATVLNATCWLMPGAYRETVNVTHSRTYRAVQPGTAALSGLDALTGLTWRPFETHKCVYSAVLPAGAPQAFQQVFWQGDMMVEARWPNLNVSNLWNQSLSHASWAPTGAGSKYGQILDPALRQFNFSWDGALATLQVAHQFYTWTRRVQDHVALSERFSYPQDLPGLAQWTNKTTGWDHNMYFLSGKLEALDAPGEWFLQPADSTQPPTLFFYPPTCSSPTDGSLEVKVRDYAFFQNTGSQVPD